MTLCVVAVCGMDGRAMVESVYRVFGIQLDHRQWTADPTYNADRSVALWLAPTNPYHQLLLDPLLKHMDLIVRIQPTPRSDCIIRWIHDHAPCNCEIFDAVLK